MRGTNFNRIHGQMNVNESLSEELKKEAETEAMRSMEAESEIHPVSVARSYGVKKREYRILEFFKTSAVRVFAVMFLWFLFATPIIGMAAFLLFANLLLTTVFMVMVTLIAVLIVTRSMRKRLKFQRKLKKICAEKGYRMKPLQGFFDSLFWSPDRLDFSLSTGRFTYYVHYLTVPKYQSSVTFVDDHTFVRTKYPMRNVFTVIFGFKPHSKIYHVNFPTLPSSDTHRSIAAIIVNPVCRDLYVKTKNGTTEATGSGGVCGCYTVFTGSGFLNTLLRNESMAKREEKKWY